MLHAGADIHTAARGGPHAAAGGCVLKEAAAHGKRTLEQRKRVRRKECQRETTV